jgi:hypothetical protein
MAGENRDVPPSHSPGRFCSSEKDETMPADVLVENHGSVALFTPMTPEAHQWVEENVEIEPWQRMGCSIACEPRCLEQLVKGMQQGGLVVE